MEKVSEGDWDFKRADTQYLTHGLHPYPARMPPQIAQRLIRRFAPRVRDKVLDPFCGSGGVLVEAALEGRKAFGLDLNPLALLIARAKTTPLGKPQLEGVTGRVLNQIESAVGGVREGVVRVELPDDSQFPHLLFWFKEGVARELAVVAGILRGLEGEELLGVRRLLEVCFSATALKASNIDVEDNPYFIRALKGERLEKHNPDVPKLFEAQFASAKERIYDYSARCRGHPQPEIYHHDAKDLCGVVEEGSIALVVTSPPYGEEKRTMAYSSFAKLPLYWLGYEPSNLRGWSRMTLGGGRRANSLPPNSPILAETLREIEERDLKAALEVASFFSDYFRVLSEIRRALKPKGRVCVVVGDRRVRGVVVRNGAITSELGGAVGLRLEGTIQRNIPRKVLPRSDGRMELINRESIIIMRK